MAVSSMKKLIFAMLFALAACAVHTPQGSVIVDPHHHGSGQFCPPGQAKKGNC